VAVLGAGSWGTAVATICARSASTVLWARRPELAAQICAEHRNAAYLPDLALPETLDATASLSRAVDGADLLVMAVPSHGFRGILEQAAPAVPPGAPVVSLAKGLEQGSLRRMTQVCAEVLPGHPAGVLTGPNLSREVVAGQPTASVVAIDDAEVANEVQLLLSTDTFRVYTNDDVVGCEIAGALKNVMAIAAGMADGMGFGDNSKAALITRGLAELARLGVAMGGNPLTFAGLAGMGDLVATCISPQSRNRHVGHELGRGRALAEVIAEMNMVAEGVKTAPSALELAQRHEVEVPIVEQVVEVLSGRKTARQIIPALMRRQVKPELHGLELQDVVDRP
jgi:glycerol-3-phosphate dehydrogenase (NAD(P)+)